MATSPQFPQPPRRGPHVVPKLQVPKKGLPWPLLAIIVAAAILIALIVWLPRTPRARAGATGAAVPAQPTPGQIELSQMKMTAAPVGSAYYLEGMLLNSGNTEITGVQVQVNFVDNIGTVAGSQKRPVGEMNGRTGLSSQNLVDSPVKPGQSRPIRIYFDHPPANWNKQMPELTVAEVTATKP